MSSSRQYILDRVRAAKKGGLAKTDSDVARSRLHDHSPNLIPKRGSVDKEARISLFAEEAEKVDASVVRLKHINQVPQEIARFLKAANLQPKIRSTEKLKNLPWSETLLDVETGPVIGSDGVGVTVAFAGVAETGTLVVCSGPGSPTALNFLPLTNVAIVEADKIYGNYEDVFKNLRAQSGKGQAPIDYMPRTLNFITGPSRSADIEQTLLLGAHGPQRLHIIIVDDGLA